MLKLTGSIIIIVISYLTGNIFIHNNIEKLVKTENMITFFKVLKEQLYTGFCDISTAINYTCEKVEISFERDFLRFSDIIQNSDINSFKKAYDNSEEQYSLNMKKIIKLFADKLDENGLSSSYIACDEMVTYFSEIYEKDKIKVGTDNKLIRNFSICAGFAIVILLV